MNYAVFANFYDELMQEVPYEDVQEKVGSLLKRYGVSRGLLLDLACGTGTVSLALSKKGYDVIGVDASAEMLMEAQEKARKEKADILFLCQDMCHLDLYGTIDAAICTLDGLNHLESKEEVQEALSKVSLFLNPEGIFIFDVNSLYKHQHILCDNTFLYEAEDVFCAWQNTLLEDGESVQMDLDFFIEEENGLYQRESESLKERAYPLAVWKKMLEKAGFTILEILDGYSDQKPTDTTERYLFVVQKKREEAR